MCAPYKPIPNVIDCVRVEAGDAIIFAFARDLDHTQAEWVLTMLEKKCPGVDITVVSSVRSVVKRTNGVHHESPTEGAV